MVTRGLAQGGGVKVRQQAPTLDGIRDDHLARYRWAVTQAQERGLTWAHDAGCGVGYGSWILAEEAGLWVLGYDREPAAVEYAQAHYRHRKVVRGVRELHDTWPVHAGDIGVPQLGMVVAFEIIEHSAAAPAFLARAAPCASLLVGSVPNQDVVPFVPGKVNAEHVRHYTPSEISVELEEAGWRVVMLGCQTGKRGPGARVREDTTAGRTLVFVAESKHVSGAAR